MFRVKICGITNVHDAQIAVDAGADAIGLNFYSASARHVSVKDAQKIAAGLPPSICKVGVFVNAPADEVRRAARLIPLDLVQLHGDEPPEFLRDIRPLPVMRAVHVADDLSQFGAYLAACHRLRALPRMLLVDAAHNGQYGGTGRTADWNALVQHRHHLAGLPLVLAGGLSPDNVAAAIAAVHPWGVDVASGVEASPGVKSPELVGRFVCAAKQAFERLTAPA